MAAKDNLQQTVIATLAFAESVSYPLSVMEIWRGLLRPGASPEGVSVQAVATALKELVDAGAVREENGLFLLPNNQLTSEERTRRYRIAERKFRRARALARFLRHFPFIRVLAVCNSLAVANTREDSDIDLFIIVAPQRLWSARLLSVGLLRLLRLRPGEAARDPVCLHFFVSADALDLRDVALLPSSSGTPDIYLAWWITELTPLIDSGIMQQFVEANAWVREELPNAAPKVASPRREVVAPSVFANLLERLWPAPLEVWAERWQRQLLPAELSKRANTGTEVVLSASRIKCHGEDRRAQYRALWEERVRAN